MAIPVVGRPSDTAHEDPVHEGIAVQSYSEIIRCLGDDERTTRTVIEKTLAKEEQTAANMNRILETLSKAGKNARDAIKPYPARAERFEPYSRSEPSPRGLSGSTGNSVGEIGIR